MDADERALLAAIIAHPDEDTPRLVYADWCDENGRPERAELIRAQIGLARTKGDTAEPQRAVWQARVRALLKAHSERWRKELPSIPRVRWGAFEGGMVQSVTLTLHGWSDAVPAGLANLFGHAPLRALRAHYAMWYGARAADCTGLLGWHGLSRFDELRLAAHFYAQPDEAEPTGPFLAPLWTHSWSDRPCVLDLRECEMPEEAVRPLLDSRPRPLPTLVLLRRQFGEPVRAALTARLGTGVRFV